MKIKFIILTACFLIFTKFATAQTLTKIIEELSKQIHANGDSKMTIKNLATKTFIINSSSNARLSGGKTRDVVKVEMPEGTKKWYYRVTVLDVDSKYSYQSNETLHYLLTTLNTQV